MREIIFNDFIKLNRGFDLPSQSVIPGAYPIVASSTIRGFHKNFKVAAPGVVTGRSGSLGTVQFIKQDFWPLNTSLYVKNFKGNDPLFVSYFLRAMCLENFNSGAGVPTLNQNHLQQLRIRIPNLASQQKIAAILSAYDDLIANNQRRITLLERMAEDIYREWFVRLRFPGHEQVKIEKGVPQGWAKRRFGDFCVLKRGYDLPDAAIEPGPYPVIASTSIKAHHKFFKTLPPVITTGRSGSLGDVLYINAKAWPLNTALYVKDFCENSPFLIFYTLKNMGLETFNAGAGVPSLNRNHLNGISIAVPPQTIQTAFDAKLSPIFTMKEGLEKQVEVLKATRDTLLPRLISGKLAVDTLDIHFPPSMTPSAQQ